MPVSVSYIEDDKHCIAIAAISGMNPSEDMTKAIDEELIPYINSKAPAIVHVIYDITHIEWTFPEFMAYLSRTAERRKRGGTPSNLSQHFVGSGVWMNNWRSWLQKNYNINTSSFRTIEDALEFINRLD